MPTTNLKKMTYKELYTSTSMFYVNHTFEEQFENEICNKVDDIFHDMQSITSRESLKRYIIDHKDAIDNLTSLMEISTERFKRMVSMIRKDRGFVFATEWSLGKIRTAMMENPSMMEDILSLMWNGRDQERYQSSIPAFFLENMAIDASTQAKLTDRDSIRRFVKRGLEGKYSNQVGDMVLADVQNTLRQICARHGLEFQAQAYVPSIGRTVSFVLEDPKKPVVIIDVSYSVTTSSSQSTWRETVQKTFETVKKLRSEGKNVVYVNFIDGAGWIGRQADMKEIHRCSDYVINFKNLNVLADIIEVFIEEF